MPTCPVAAGSFSAGVVLEEEQYLASESNNYQLWMQSDGNLVIYEIRTAPDAPWPIWALNAYTGYTARVPGPYRLVLQVGR